eukprot:6214503-Pleurochrysis_carterae.AAC.1
MSRPKTRHATTARRGGATAAQTAAMAARSQLKTHGTLSEQLPWTAQTPTRRTSHTPSAQEPRKMF